MNKAVQPPMRFLIKASLFLLLLSCNNRDKVPDVSSIAVNLKMERFEEGFFTMDTLHIAEGINRVAKQYPAFFPLFTGQILSIPNLPPDAFTNGTAAGNELVQM